MELARERNKERNANNTPAIGIEHSPNTTHIVNPLLNPPPAAAPAAAPANAELQATVTLANIENHSVIGVVSSFVSVGDQTGDTSSISEGIWENKKIIDHIHQSVRLC